MWSANRGFHIASGCCRRTFFRRTELTFLGRQAVCLVPLLAEHAQNLLAPVTRQHVREKSPVADDDADCAHELLRGRKALVYAAPSTTIRPPHQTGACKLASTVGGGSRHSAMPLARISAP